MLMSVLKMLMVALNVALTLLDPTSALAILATDLPPIGITAQVLVFTYYDDLNTIRI